MLLPTLPKPKQNNESKNENFITKLFNMFSMGEKNPANQLTQTKKRVADQIRQAAPFLAGLDDNSLAALAKSYNISEKDLFSSITGIDPASYTSGLEDLYRQLETSYDYLKDPSILQNLPTSVNRELLSQESEDLFNKDLQASLASEQGMLGNIQDTYDTYRKDMLQEQNLNRGQIMNAYQNAFRDQRSRAIEAGASAGLKLANNVNALLSAQNAQRATSLETSNQLANMALQQQNAALMARSQAEQNRLASGLTERSLDAYKTQRYNTASQQNELQRENFMREQGDKLAGMGIQSDLSNILLKQVGRTGYDPRNIGNFNRPDLGSLNPQTSSVTTPSKQTSSFGSNFGTPGAMSTGFNSNFLGNTQQMSDYLRRRNR